MSEHYVIGNGVITDGFSYLLNDGAIEIEDGLISQIGKTGEVKKDSIKFIDLGGRLVLPGFLNPHHHLYSALATGIAPSGETNSFIQILKNLWWRLDQSLDEETIYFSAIYGLINSIKYGVTTIFDHHASMNYIRNSLKIIKKAFKETGVKGLLCFEISDRMGMDALASQLQENLSFYSENLRDSSIHGVLGLHANFTLSNKTLSIIQREKPDELPIHIHCGEDAIDLQYCQELGFHGPVHRLYEYNLLSSNALLAHCIHLSEKDYELIQQLKPIIISNPESNANNKVGEMNISKIPRYCLGTDGMTDNIAGTIRSFFLLRKGKIEHPLDVAFQYPHEIISRFFPDSGILHKGRRADIAVTDYIPVTEINLDNLFSHLIFGVQGQKMWMTISDGKILYKAGRILICDEENMLKKVKIAAKKLHTHYYE